MSERERDVIAALYVAKGGCYFGLPNVDPWDAERDARLYDGPWPVVAHPPCERWGKYHAGSPIMVARGIRLTKGDDGGCFAAALASVRRWGGVLEHPEGSAAWPHFGLRRPHHDGRWTPADWPEHDGWTCCVEQGAFGHDMRKKTWLYAYGVEIPTMPWGRTPGEFRYMCAPSAARTAKANGKPYGWSDIPKWKRAATPLPFRDLLISIAETANRQVAA